jgi:L-fuconolactonase
MRIDSHQHFWRYTPDDYPWIAPDWQVLQRDFLPDDLRPLLAAHQLDGAIAVQAQQTIDETRWLLQLAADHPDIVKGVVGWVPLVDGDVARMLEELATSATGAALKGVRHILQSEADDAYMLREDFNRGVERLRAYALTYDILIYGRHLANAAAFVDRHPDQTFVLDHIAKPEILADRSSPAQPSRFAARTTVRASDIRAEAFDRAWADGLRELARRPNVMCKLSGVVTETRDAEWTHALIAPYLETALEAFGPFRILFGTDWPVCLLRCEYHTWVDTVTSFISTLTPDEQDAIMGGNAVRAYGLLESTTA